MSRAPPECRVSTEADRLSVARVCLALDLASKSPSQTRTWHPSGGGQEISGFGLEYQRLGRARTNLCGNAGLLRLSGNLPELRASLSTSGLASASEAESDRLPTTSRSWTSTIPQAPLAHSKDPPSLALQATPQPPFDFQELTRRLTG